MKRRFGLLTTFPATGSQNVGDALITDSLKRILLHLDERTTFIQAFRGDDLSSRLDDFNSCDALLLPGFAIRRDTWPRIYALTDNPSDITAPIVAVGAGVKDDSSHRIDQAHALPPSIGTRAILQRIAADAGFIATRDSYTQAAVSAYDLPAKTVGDCALFDPPHIGKPLQIPPAIRSVGFTPPRRPHLVGQAIEIISAVSTSWPDATISILRHGRPNATERKVEERSGVRVIEVSGEDTTSLIAHDDFDLHVGYRVHAHLYRLRTRRPSLLLEEDSRAIGFNRLLGLEGVPCATGGHPNTRRNLPRAALRRLGINTLSRKQLRSNAAPVVVDILRRYERDSFSEFEPALAMIDWHYHERMVPFLRKLF